MIVFLDRQHCGKPDRLLDVGCHPPNHGGDVEYYEVMLTAKYIYHAEVYLRDKGCKVVVLSDGTYKDRHERVNKIIKSYNQKSCYIACHINAGGGDYAACFFDFRSTQGPILAQEIGIALQEIPEIERNTKRIPSMSSDWTRNAYYTIKGVNPPAICFEPFFVDCKDHVRLLEDEGLKQIGVALAKGIINWGKS